MMSDRWRRRQTSGLTSIAVVAVLSGLAGCSSSSGTTDAPSSTAATAATAESSPSTGDAPDTLASSTVEASTVASAPVGPVTNTGCLTNGTMSGPFEEKVVDAITQVNTQNAGENAPDAYYATSWGKNTIGYFAFGGKATIVVNGDGSWSGQSGADGGKIEVAPDGTSATVQVTLEGSDATGQRAKPLTLNLITKCGVVLPVTVPPAPVNTKQNVTVSIVEDTTPAKTPS
jgi:hypothetical protein